MTKPKPPEQKAGAKPLPTPKVGGTYKAKPGEVPKRVTGTDSSTTNNPNPAPSPAKTGQPPTSPGDE